MAVHERKGKPGPKKRRRVSLPDGLPAMPRGYLPPMGRKFWRQVGEPAAELGILGPADYAGLLMCAGHFAIAAEALKQLRQDGPVTVDERGLLRKHPAGQLLRDNSAAFRSWLKELGLTPVSRAGLVVEDPHEPSLADALFDLMAPND